MSATISTQVDATHCNYHTIQLEGINSLSTDLETVLQNLIDTEGWAASDSITTPTSTNWLYPSTATADIKNSYTDGYKITSTQVVTIDGVIALEGGMCFGVDPTTNGGYCHVYTTSTNAGELAVDGHFVKWLTSSEWSSTTYP